MITAIAAAEPPDPPRVSGGGYTYAGSGYTITWDRGVPCRATTCTTTQVTVSPVRVNPLD